MPFKDEDKRREYHKQYSKEWNAAHRDQVRENKRVQMRRWRESNPALARDHQLKKNYGLPVGMYQVIHARQMGLCAICLKTDGDKSLAVDHCHATGVIRGLLCGKCNTGLACFLDSETNLGMAIEYLERSKREGWTAWGANA